MRSAGSARKRSKIFSTKYFAFVLALIVFGVFLLITPDFFLFDSLQLRVLDFHFFQRISSSSDQQQAGVTVQDVNLDIHPDILIVGIDNRTLADFGAWPFPRYRHSDFLNTLSRIQDDTAREAAVFLDFFFVEPSSDAVSDSLLTQGISENGRVFLQSALTGNPPPVNLQAEYYERHDLLFSRLGSIGKIQGDWSQIPLFQGMEPPLKPMIEGLAGYGHANWIADRDGSFRMQPLVVRTTKEIGSWEAEEFRQNSANILAGASGFSRLAWNGADGRLYSEPVFAADGSRLIDDIRIGEILEELANTAAPRIIDTDNDGTADRYEYDISLYEDHLMPSITLALAMEYLNVSISDVELVLGSHILLPGPRVYDPETGALQTYRIQTRLPEYDENGTETSPAQYREMPEIRIPIDENAAMRVNFMGLRSSADPGGEQVFPVRPYSAYARRATGPYYDTWPRTMALDNKIVMAGMFAAGIDEKSSAVGQMYGIEMHANALNTILMDKFIADFPEIYRIGLLFLLIALIAIITSRSNTFIALAVLVLLFIPGIFIAAQLVFESQAVLIQSVHPSFAMIFAFLSVVIYRGLTEEREKRRVQGMFGQYVSAEVVEELVDNSAPPELGGVDKELTVFFSDIRGFTTLSEKMQPQELVNHLNIYLSSMTDIIMHYKGTLDKYVGDEIMCFWGAPMEQKYHAILACQSALAQMRKLEELNSQWPMDRRIDIGIGINSGIMTVGNMGSAKRMNYTLMGDNVNLGARLEGINKQYFGQEWAENGRKYVGSGSKIIISEYTYGLVKDLVVARELDNIRVKGKNKPVVIYELIDALVGMEPYQG